MALRIFALNLLYFALTNATKGISTHTVLINSDIEIEWFLRKYQVRSTVLEKDGAQLLILDPRKQSDVTKGQFYAELTENVRVMLRISNVTPRNGGIYSHITYYDTGNADKGTFLLQVQGSPGLFNVTTDVTEGEAITAQCCVKSSMEPRLTWMVDTGIVHDNTHSLEIATVSGYRYCGQIMLTSQRIHNGKEMICEVQNGLNLSASSHLNVFYQPTINISVKGTNTCATRSCIFKEFANVTLLCSTDGNPKPNVTLTRIVKPGEFDKRKTYFTEKWSTMKSFFLFDNFTRMLYGRYRCEANNGIGDIVFDAVLLNVTFAATVNIVVSPTPDTVTPHGNFTVECEAYSNPFPTISLQKKIHEEWITLRNSVSPQTKRRLRYQAVWTLSYDEVYNDYMGIYRCMADNGIGRPAQSNTTVLYAVQDVDESSPVSRKPLLICVILFVVFGISSLTFFYNRRQIAKLSRRYSRRLHPRFDTVDFPDVVRAHHALDVENRMLHRDLPANPCKEGNVDSERPVVYDHCYEQCLGGNSGRKLSVSYQDPEDDFADGPELDINGYARLSPETASICERDDANHQVANIYIDDRVPECANSD
ncbi:peroxidasin homolog isoform X1 [Apostichopus japonicus]|uniref:peroxidasin homolog isoform X1 n=2 Tax=Stichopus japonicus TaxID=307972 RepID=UPI003AB67C45